MVNPSPFTQMLLSPSSSPATSPTMSNSSSPTPPTPLNYNHKITGIPCVAAASRYTAPVHIDVGGTIYTSSLETLTNSTAEDGEIEVRISNVCEVKSLPRLIFYFTTRGPPRVITALKERGRGGNQPTYMHLMTPDVICWGLIL
uniref:Potassium channel tetramerisation-type BTB domain-containing protein n=1 Tax=Timema cristinae TaxID=61476 RepID=A0A7R9GUS2_TIMCR|nr:unnamed protein product [Timema cristinae]